MSRWITGIMTIVCLGVLLWYLSTPEPDTIMIVTLGIVIIFAGYLFVRSISSSQLVEVNPELAVTTYRVLLHRERNVSMPKDSYQEHFTSTQHQHRWIFSTKDRKNVTKNYFIFSCNRYRQRGDDIVFNTPFGVITDKESHVFRFKEGGDSLAREELRNSIDQSVQAGIEGAIKKMREGERQEARQ